MSRSTQPFKGFFSDGWHLVAIMESISQHDGILITFADDNNNKRQELFKMDKHFIKMCGDAGLITEESVFDSEKAIGARLMIQIVEGIFADTKGYDGGVLTMKDVKVTQDTPMTMPFAERAKINKAKIIAEAKEMIKKVESNEFDM
jgi:hypothetical protein